ncbi:UNVERIFIED_CONTAM: Retrovirus-related Pol polyprotein from transposon RE2 [Sesamum calycinum]|uniref:Retrovirus-related Pol polyprotein from transposon RE2 n=1 Tax=Sesamum calycinum TaxID=2727403 RepID=A0AAW2LUC4_9LAMI
MYGIEDQDSSRVEYTQSVNAIPNGDLKSSKIIGVGRQLGYTQIEGIDYFDSFSSIAKTVTVRLFLAIASSHSWPILQLDVNNAFLHGHFNEEWNKEFTSKIEAYGFRQSQHDHCLFLRRSSTSFLALLVYVDDVLITGTSLSCIQDVNAYLDNLFTIKDLGFAHYFFRFGVGTFFSWYICDAMQAIDWAFVIFGFFPSGYLLCRATAQPISTLPREPHWDAAMHLLHYLKDSSTLGLFFPASTSLQLCSYSDSDWASCSDARWSITGAFSWGALISWKSKKQTTVSSHLWRQSIGA